MVDAHAEHLRANERVAPARLTMGKVPNWAMPTVVYSGLGFVAAMVPAIEGLHVVGLTGPSPFGGTDARWFVVVFGLAAASLFALGYQSWRNVSPRICPKCGRYVPFKVSDCSTCGYYFS